MGEAPSPGKFYYFIKTSDYEYCSECIEHEKVEVLNIGGVCQAKVRWTSGFTFWVKHEDLVAAASGLSVAYTSLIPNAVNEDSFAVPPRYDFGAGFSRCSVTGCRTLCLNRGCEDTRQVLCHNCWPAYSLERRKRAGGA